MKTAKWLINAWLVACAAPASASLFLSAEGDARAGYAEGSGTDAEIHAVAGSVRKVWSDQRGDRVIGYVEGEWAQNLSDFQLHQAYAEWKGPMGRWNAAVGRVPLPWGLLTSWRPDRMPYSSPYGWTRTLESDNGALLRGMVDDWEYGLALTQGYGMEQIEDFPGPGHLTGRLGWTPAVDGDVTVGLSLAVGTAHVSEHGHAMMVADKERRTAVAADGTWYAGRGTYRLEGGARRTEEHWHGTLFVTAEYALLPRLAAQVAGQVHEEGPSQWSRRAYGGVSIPLPWFTLRGGYEYEHSGTEEHRVVVQLYRPFRFVR